MTDAGVLINSALTTYAPLTTLVAGKIYALAAPDGTVAPYVIFQRMTGGKILELDGPADIENPHYQVFCFAATQAAARDVGDKAKAAMEAAATFEALLVNDPDEYDPESALFVTILEFSIWNQ